MGFLSLLQSLGFEERGCDISVLFVTEHPPDTLCTLTSPRIILHVNKEGHRKSELLAQSHTADNTEPWTSNLNSWLLPSCSMAVLWLDMLSYPQLKNYSPVSTERSEKSSEKQSNLLKPQLIPGYSGPISVVQRMIQKMPTPHGLCFFPVPVPPLLPTPPPKLDTPTASPLVHSSPTSHLYSSGPLSAVL